MLPAVSASATYTQTLAITGAVAPYRWSATGLPPGLSLSSDGTLNGAATAAGAFTPRVTVQDNSTPPVTATIDYTLDAQQLTLTPASLPPAISGSAYNQVFTVSGGSPPYTWSPARLSNGFGLVGQRDGSTAALGGTVGEPGDYPLVVTVADSSVPPRTATRSMMLRVLGFRGFMYRYSANLGSCLIFQPVPRWCVQASIPFAGNFQPISGTPPYTWSATGLPPGLAMSKEGGVSGTPQSGGDYLGWITLQDNSVPPLVLTFRSDFYVLPSAVLITSAELPDSFLGAPYSTTLGATGGNPPYQWTATALPVWLTLSSDGVLSGTPPSAAAVYIEVQVRDSSAVPLTAIRKLNFKVQPALASAITTSSLPDGTVGVSYNQLIFTLGNASDGAISAGSLPDGLTVQSVSTQMQIAGTPTKAGHFAFTVETKNYQNQIATQPMSIFIAPSPKPVITTKGLPPAFVGVGYSAALDATGGTPPYAWTAYSPAGSLNGSGLTLSSAGVLSGMPSANLGMPLTVTVRDSANPPSSSSANFDLWVRTPATSKTPMVTTPSLPDGAVGEYYSQPLNAVGGAPPYTWSVCPGFDLPPGLKLNPVSGVISGVPTEPDFFYNNTGICVTDSLNAFSSKTLPLTIHWVTPTGAATRIGVFSQIASGGGWKTSLYVVNQGETPAQVTVNFKDDNGAALTLPFSVLEIGGTQMQNAATLTTPIAANATLLIETSSSPEVLSGWAEVLSSNANVSGYGVFHYTSATGVESEGTVPLDASTSSILLLPYEAGNGFAVGLALANLSAAYSAAPNEIIAWDEHGSLLSQTAAALPAGGHSSFMLKDRIPAVTGHRGYVQVNSTAGSGLPGPNITGLGLRVNPAGGFTSTMALQEQVSGTAVFAQVASGGGWRTSLYFTKALNPTSTSGFVTVSFYADDGTPLTLPLTVTKDSGVETLNASTVVASFDLNSTALVETTSSSPTAQAGWAIATIDQGMTGYGVFHYTSPEGAESEGTVPLDSQIGSSFVLPYDCTNGLGMGVALVNKNWSWPASVVAMIVDENGVPLPGANFNLGANGHESFNLTDKIPAAAGHRGFVRFMAVPAADMSGRPFNLTGIGLRVNPVGGFTSTPKLQ